MDAVEKFIASAEKCVTSAIDVTPGSDSGTSEREQFWLQEAQVHATLAVAAALHELRQMFARDPSAQDSGAFIRVAGRVETS